jgi:hypothetical protein
MLFNDHFEIIKSIHAWFRGFCYFSNSKVQGTLQVCVVTLLIFYNTHNYLHKSCWHIYNLSLCQIKFLIPSYNSYVFVIKLGSIHYASLGATLSSHMEKMI